jgi:hypothetical protein
MMTRLMFHEAPGDLAARTVGVAGKPDAAGQPGAGIRSMVSNAVAGQNAAAFRNTAVIQSAAVMRPPASVVQAAATFQATSVETVFCRVLARRTTSVWSICGSSTFGWAPSESVSQPMTKWFGNRNEVGLVSNRRGSNRSHQILSNKLQMSTPACSEVSLGL